MPLRVLGKEKECMPRAIPGRLDNLPYPVLRNPCTKEVISRPHEDRCWFFAPPYRLQLFRMPRHSFGLLKPLADSLSITIAPASGRLEMAAFPFYWITYKFCPFDIAMLHITPPPIQPNILSLFHTPGCQ